MLFPETRQDRRLCHPQRRGKMIHQQFIEEHVTQGIAPSVELNCYVKRAAQDQQFCHDSEVVCVGPVLLMSIARTNCVSDIYCFFYLLYVMWDFVMFLILYHTLRAILAYFLYWRVISRPCPWGPCFLMGQLTDPV